MKIPSYDNSVGPQTPTVPQAQPSRMVAGAGTLVPRAIVDLGEMGTKIAGVLQNHAEKQYRLKVDSQVADLDTNFRQNLQDKLFNDETEKVNVRGAETTRSKGILNRPLDTAENATVEFDSYYKEMAPRYLSSVQDPEARAKLKASMDSHFTNERDSVIRHESTQLSKARLTKFEANLALRVKEAVTRTTPASLKSAIDESVGVQNSINVESGFDEDTSRIKNIDVAGAIALNATSSLLMNTGSMKSATALLDTAKEAIGQDKYEEVASVLKKQDIAAKQQAKFLAGMSTGSPGTNFYQYSDYMDSLSNLSRSIDAGADKPKIEAAAAKIRMEIANDKALTTGDKKTLIFGKSVGRGPNLRAVIDGKFDLGDQNKIDVRDRVWDIFAKGATNKRERVAAWNKFLDTVSDGDDKNAIDRKVSDALINATLATRNIPIGKDWKTIKDASGARMMIRATDNGYEYQDVEEESSVDGQEEENPDVNE